MGESRRDRRHWPCLSNRRVDMWSSTRLLGSRDRKSTRLNSSHLVISYAVFCLKKKTKNAMLYLKLIRLCLASVERYFHIHAVLFFSRHLLYYFVVMPLMHLWCVIMTLNSASTA